MPVKCLPYVLLLFILLPVTASPLHTAAPPSPEDDHPSKAPPLKTYEVHFISLSRGHHIATSTFVFGEENNFEIRIPSETFLSTRGTYTKSRLRFETFWEGTLIKHRQEYCYTFTIHGLSLGDTYIAGILKLKESIKEINQNQAVTFLFIGTPLSPDENKGEPKGPLPF